ncbi:papain-like cysteine peptidase [Klebsiella quasipneumoniae]|uniref:papain-like cysteine peptidase n=1 Tax=Klebsiella quasipneumoniae TaxID=1463165 RepID=UPI00217E9666|nr:papain-like cysteine peptidase [Klebsiella quasipneumoniae]MCS6746325.1 papain-like cysteine peptidase [Klebsiella quasipneumoniae]
MTDNIQEKYLKILLIKSTYKTLLGRPADPDGLKNYYHAISDKPLAESAQLLNSSLMNSDEFRELTSSRMAFGNVSIPPHPESGTETQGRLAVKHIVSLGSHCLTSWTLKKFNLKKTSLPFDWIFSCPAMVIDCLRDDFQTFLDKNEYSSLNRQSKEPGAHHNKYKEKYHLNDIFTHRDPTTPTDYAYYVRAVKRFRNILKSADGKLFVICCREEIDLAKALPALVAELAQHTTNFYLLAFSLRKPSQLQLESIAAGDNYSLYRFTPESEEKFTGKFPSLTDEMVFISKVLSFNLEL